MASQTQAGGVALPSAFRQEAAQTDFSHTRDPGAMSEQKTSPKQLLHLVFGGELTSLDGVDFRDLDKLDIVGIYPSYAEAYVAWKAAAQRTVDNAMMRYFIVHMHRLLVPDEPDAKAQP
jgi:uncharacterized protein DUF4170